MDWFDVHYALLEYHNKIIMFLDDNWEHTMVRGIPRPVPIHQISTMQVKNYIREGYQLYTVHVEEISLDKGSHIEDYVILKE